MFNQRLAPLSKKGTIGGSPIRWLLRDEFTTDLNPGSVNGTAAEPGPGTRTIFADTANAFGLSSGSSVPTTTGPGTGDPGLAYGGFSRTPGLMLFVALKYYTVTGTRYQFGFMNAPASGLEDFMTDFAGIISAKNVQMLPYDGGFWTPDGSIGWFAILERSAGAFYMFQSVTGIWKLAHIGASTSGATLYPTYQGRTTLSSALTSMRIPRYYWLPSPLLSDSFNRSNGVLGSTDGAGHTETTGLGSGGSGIAWVHSGWTIGTNRAQPGTATTGPNLITNGTFDNWTGGNPDGWTVVETLPNSEISETAPGNLHGAGGTGACNIYSAAGIDASISQNGIITPGKIYRLNLDITARSAGQIQIYGHAYTIGGSSLVTSYTFYIVGASSGNLTIGRQTGATDLTIDNVSLYEMDFTNLTALKDLGTPDVVWSGLEVNWNQAEIGAMLCANAESNPTNYIAILLCNLVGVSGRCLVMKCINGSISVVATLNFTAGVNKIIQVVKDGTSIGVYYDGAFLTSVTTISDVEVINNTIHGMYASPSGSGTTTQYESIVIYPRGTRGEYSILNSFSQNVDESALIPFADPFSAGSTLGSRWTGSTWSISSGKALNTPTVGSELLTNPGYEGTYVAGVAPNYILSRGTPSEYVAAPHGGVSSQQINNPAGNSAYMLGTTVALSAHNWYKWGIWTKSLAGQGSAYVQESPTSTFIGGTNTFTNAAWTEFISTGRSLATGNFSIRMFSTLNAVADTNQSVFDDVTLKQLTLNTLFATVESLVSDVTVSVGITSTALHTNAGVVACLDSTSSPANFLIGYLAINTGGVQTAYLDKCVAGVYTNVLSGPVTYVAGATLSIRKYKTYVALYYNGTQVGTTKVVSDAGIISNTKHGMFSTNSANTLDNFMLTGAPFIFLDQLTGSFDPLWTNKDTWSIVSNKAIATPVSLTPRTIVNGDFSAWTGDNPDNWTVVLEDAANYITESAGKLRIVSDNSKNVSATSQAIAGAVTGKWARITVDVGAASGVYALGLSIGGSFSSANNGVASANKTIYITPRITGAPQFVIIKGTACDAIIDNVSYSELDFSELIKTIVTDRNDVAVAAEPNVILGTIAISSPLGVVACINSESSPTSFIIGYIVWRSGIYAAYFDKCVNGTYTNLGSANITYSAGAALKLVKSGTSVSLYYNNVQVGTTQTVSDAEIISNTIHGMFSTHPDNTLDNFSIG